jgi:hypothetical protein
MDGLKSCVTFLGEVSAASCELASKRAAGAHLQIGGSIRWIMKMRGEEFVIILILA